ncbi:MAG: hypothetical protein GY796_31795 [Chloroflexi bacterium]|nr:hypothetical protein [Chloroflexota bacterium]
MIFYTLFGILWDLLQNVPTSGDAWIDGRSITQNARSVKQLIRIVPREIALYDSISAHENLHF